MKIKLGSPPSGETPTLRFLVAIFAVGILFIIAIWSGVGEFSFQKNKIEPTFGAKIILTIGICILLGMGYVGFLYQKRKDAAIRSGEYISSRADKVIETTYKVSGWYAKVRGIGAMIGCGIALIVSLVVLVLGLTREEGIAYFIFSFILFVAAIGAGVNAYIYLKRSKALVQGRFY